MERLCRYILRPPFAQERLRLRTDGRIALTLKTAWHDGTRELLFEPLELLERLAAMIPRLEANLLISHGLLAPRARGRPSVVAYGRVVSKPPAVAPLAGGAAGGEEPTKLIAPRSAGAARPRCSSRPSLSELLINSCMTGTLGRQQGSSSLAKAKRRPIPASYSHALSLPAS
ncbi:MAG TPA: transposase, partial [Gemmatimonadales bacterium]|nr:transposase [Gemmatimonadales bacterium]